MHRPYPHVYSIDGFERPPLNPRLRSKLHMNMDDYKFHPVADYRKRWAKRGWFSINKNSNYYKSYH